MHYIEYLGELIMEKKIDPLEIFDEDQLEQVMRKNNIKFPAKTQHNYKQVLIDVIKEQCPLDKMA